MQVGPLDPRAQKLPLPDDLMGELMRYVVAHEVGHTLGFQHNMKASSTYTIEQIRDPKWVKENGHTPSLMDYSRFNYVAQPEDGIDRRGSDPEDRARTTSGRRKWGYAPIPGAKTPDEEKPTLDKWAREQDEKPYLRFSTEGTAAPIPATRPKPSATSTPSTATRLGIKNLSRVSEMLIAATSYKAGDPWDELEEVYGRMVGQWTTEMNHVVRVVGGVRLAAEAHRPGGRAVRDRRAGRGRRRRVQFLLANAFTDADVHDPAGDSAPHSADGHRRARCARRRTRSWAPAAGRAARPHGRAGGARWADRLSAGRSSWATCARHLGRARHAGARRSTSTAATCSASYLDTIDQR